MADYEDRDSGKPGKPWANKNVENAEVAEPGPALQAMAPDIKRIATLLAGTDALREAAQEYLPMHQYETKKAYTERLAVSYLDNYTLRTLNTLVGKAFKEPPKPGEDMPEPLVEFLDDVDDAGTGFIPFARQVFRKSAEQAVSHVLVDMPAPMPREDGAPRSLADDAREGIRPIWRHITAEDMLDIQVGKVLVNGETKIRPTLVRFRDDEVRAAGRFTTELVKRVKVLRHEGSVVTWEMWEFQKGPRGGKPKWVEVQPPVPFGLPLIPLASHYTDRTGVGEGRPPLSDLAFMNIRHWQSTSDQINILTISRFPMLGASGVRETDGDGQGGGLVVGPNKFLTTPDPQSKIYYIEHTGAAVDSGKGELEGLEEAMSAYGAEFTKKGAQGPETASGRILDEGEAISPLQAWGIDFKDFLELCLWYTALWLKLPEDTETPVEFEIEVEAGVSGDMTTIDAARGRKDISRAAWASEAQRRGILSDDFDPEADQLALNDEPPPPGGLEGMFPGQKAPKEEKKPEPKKPEPKKPEPKTE